ncbi:MAG: hypothetical protein U9R68_05010 [Planctomycetota bacterium]|nr:hypothetical protein [Planctomycetota bacterium]
MLARLKGEGLAAKTINEYLNAANAFLNWCVAQGRLPANPLANVQRTDQTAKARRRRALTLAELHRLLEAAGPRRLLYLVMELMRHTDLRLTMNVYANPRILDTSGAVEQLPDMTGAAQAAGERVLPKSTVHPVASGHTGARSNPTDGIKNACRRREMVEETLRPAKPPLFGRKDERDYPLVRVRDGMHQTGIADRYRVCCERPRRLRLYEKSDRPAEGRSWENVVAGARSCIVSRPAPGGPSLADDGVRLAFAWGAEGVFDATSG